MYIAIAAAAVLLAADRVLKYLSRTGKLKFESKYLRLTHLENRGFFLGLGQKHEKLLRWLPLGVWLLAAVCLLPQLCKRAFTAQLGIAAVLLGGISNQWDRLRRGMKRFVKCFFELLTQIIVKVRKCKVQRVCVLHFQLAGSGGCFFLMKLYH